MRVSPATLSLSGLWISGTLSRLLRCCCHAVSAAPVGRQGLPPPCRRRQRLLHARATTSGQPKGRPGPVRARRRSGTTENCGCYRPIAVSEVVHRYRDRRGLARLAGRVQICSSPPPRTVGGTNGMRALPVRPIAESVAPLAAGPTHRTARTHARQRDTGIDVEWPADGGTGGIVERAGETEGIGKPTIIPVLSLLNIH